ncbi:hypothetical protein [Morganella morganii]|uniref:hypothetical protein n=1 Tax=Morganella morganii TaxID=582 RepID=UPI0021D2E706|nr:hypothetical protein [Morganella morganii]MCU6375527.1 hypothetical protein [Morganella morganii]HEI9843745.1 hypothetical protein [Morganella morganii]
MSRVTNYSRLPSLTKAYSKDAGGRDTGITPPELLPPGTMPPVSAMSLSEENLLKQRAYNGYFIQHLLRFAMSGSAFLVSLAASVMSGGAGIPFTVVTGTAMIIAAGDACCALYNLIQVRNDREPLKTGNDSIVLATKTLMTSFGMSDSYAEATGDIASFTLRVGISVSSLFLPFAHLPESTGFTLSCISSAISAWLIILGGGTNTYTARIERMLDNLAVSVTPVTATGDDDETGKFSQEEIQRMVKPPVAAYECSRVELNAPAGSPV